MQYLTTAEFSKNGTFHRDEFLFIEKSEGLGGYDRVIAALNSVGGKVKLDGGVLW
mgnify:CR=1 FL=1